VRLLDCDRSDGLSFLYVDQGARLGSLTTGKRAKPESTRVALYLAKMPSFEVTAPCGEGGLRNPWL
jgi:hypothetical protein